MQSTNIPVIILANIMEILFIKTPYVNHKIIPINMEIYIVKDKFFTSLVRHTFST